MAPGTKKVEASRRHYAKELANIDDEMYLIFQSAITGRANFADVVINKGASKSNSLLDMAPADSAEAQRLRQAVAAQHIIESIFAMLQQLPKRLVMVLKLK